MKVTVLTATNRLGNITDKVSIKYIENLKSKGIEVLHKDLTKVPSDVLNDGMYRKANHALRDFGHDIFLSADYFITVIPEYNGSFPGVLKLVVDACDPSIFKGKRFALAGVASGRAGNLRGMDHFTAVLHYLQAEVYSVKQPFSQIRAALNQELELENEGYLKTIEEHVNGFLIFIN
jgi:chromate reductase, NAD(P)H dehydrogenase (quinone)